MNERKHFSLSYIRKAVYRFFRSLEPVQKLPNDFWSLSVDDSICFFVMFLITLLVWFATWLTGPLKSVIAYWDGPNYVYAAITFYDIPRNNPWTKYFHYNPSYFACHLPGFPCLIRLCAFITIGNYEAADYLAIILSGLLMAYAFRRLLIIYKCVADPTWTTILLAFVPMRLFIYHSVGASEPLFIFFVCMTFIFYKADYYTYMIFAVWGCCFTRIEGMAVGAVVGFCYLLRMKIFHALMMFSTFVSTIILLAFHRGMFHDALAYIHFNSDVQKLVGWPPFPEVLFNCQTQDVGYLHSFIDFYFPYVYGALAMLPFVSPVAIFSLTYLLYVALLRHMDLYRYSLPAGVFALLIGFDCIWSHPIVKCSLPYIAPFYVILMLSYASGQIHSNRCWDDFLNEVFDAAKDHIH